MVDNYWNRSAGALRQDPRLFTPTKVRVLRPFYVAGKALQVGDIATVEAHLARDLVAVGKAELVS